MLNWIKSKRITRGVLRGAFSIGGSICSFKSMRSCLTVRSSRSSVPMTLLKLARSFAMSWAMALGATVGKVPSVSPRRKSSTVLDEPCLLCSKPGPSETCHWPYARARRSQKDVIFLPVLPLCLACHTAQHWGKPGIIDRLSYLAPAYWKRSGDWTHYQEQFETWLSRRRYIEATG